MSDTVIKIENLSKRYHIGKNKGSYKTFREALDSLALAPFKRIKRLFKGQVYGAVDVDEEIWALKDVSFEVGRGESIAIIGRNGAGKTTLLKILSRITVPTAGRVRTYGRVGALLEVGTGFHAELTGRENIYLNGAILGMKRKEIQKKFDEIIAFAEIEKFLDTPVKFYSSGMYVRLAFSVAAHLEPDILIVDEVLAVGDAAFQKKCLGRMGDVSRGGRTVLFVSHNMPAVTTLCARAILLQSGSLILDGPATDVIQNYLEINTSGNGEIIWPDIKQAPGNKNVRLRAVRIVSEGKITANVLIDKPVYIEMEFFNYISGNNICTSLNLLDGLGGLILAAGTPSAELSSGLYKVTYTFPANFLNDCCYSINVFVIINDVDIQIAEKQVINFKVHDTAEREGTLRTIMGVLRPRIESDTIRLE